MINLSFDELRLIPQIRNISDYQNKSKEELIKALSEPNPETPKRETKPKPKSQTPKPKPETPKPKPKSKQISKPRTKPKQTSKPKPKPEPEPKIEVKVNKRKLRKLRKDFDELRHKFCKKEIDRYRKTFYVDKQKIFF